jgi:uncharacterized protein YbjT (DUF2867 family)
MKVVVFGASGKTGSLLVQQALNTGHEITAYVRTPESIKHRHPKLRVIEGKLNEMDKLKEAITGADACISLLGGGSALKRSKEFVEGINNIVTTMEQEEVPRFIYMSSIGAGDSRLILSTFIRFLIVNIMLRIPLADHNANEKHIKASKLSWTIVRPAALTNGFITGNLKYGTKAVHMKGNRTISRGNVATFLLKQLSLKMYIKKAVWLYE